MLLVTKQCLEKRHDILGGNTHGLEEAWQPEPNQSGKESHT